MRNRHKQVYGCSGLPWRPESEICPFALNPSLSGGTLSLGDFTYTPSRPRDQPPATPPIPEKILGWLLSAEAVHPHTCWEGQRSPSKQGPTITIWQQKNKRFLFLERWLPFWTWKALMFLNGWILLLTALLQMWNFRHLAAWSHDRQKETASAGACRPVWCLIGPSRNHQALINLPPHSTIADKGTALSPWQLALPWAIYAKLPLFRLQRWMQRPLQPFQSHWRG